MKQLTIGQLIDRLESCPEEQPVGFDFGYFHPTTGHSFRGNYEQFAIGYKSGYPGPTVATVLGMLRAAGAGQDFYGYKGGTFAMNSDTPVWVANENEGCQIAVENVTDEIAMVVIHTTYVRS